MADHDDVEGVVGQGPLEHGVLRVADELFAGGEVTELALLFGAFEGGQDLPDGVVVVVDLEAVQVVDVDVVGVEAFEAGFEFFDVLGAGEQLFVKGDAALGGDDDRVAGDLG